MPDDGRGPRNEADRLAEAIRNARREIGEGRWDRVGSGKRAGAIYHQLCRLDTGCRRNGSAEDAKLLPCHASTSFRARRGCPY